MTRKFKQLLVLLGVTTTLLANAYPQSARTVMVQSNTGVLLFPANLWSANASSARSGLSLAAHATNPIVPVTSGGSGATNTAGARTNFGLVWSGLTNTNVADFRSALGLGATWLTNTDVTNVRASLGIPLAALTNTDVTNFRSALGLGATWLTNTDVTNVQRAVFVATNAAPSVTTNIAAWVDIRIGTNTNSFKLPLYQ